MNIEFQNKMSKLKVITAESKLHLESVLDIKAKLQSFIIERNSNVVEGNILQLDSKSIRNQYFITWLYNLSKYDIDDATLDDSFYDSITSRPERGYYVYGYYISGKIEGIIAIVNHGDDYFGICWFYVNPKQHNLGIGQALFDFVINQFHDRLLELTVRANNKGATHLQEIRFSNNWVT